MSKRQKVPRRVAPVQVMTNTPPTVHCGGKVWRLGFNTQDAKGRLEELIRSHVVRNAAKDMRTLGGEDGERVWLMESKRVKQGYYATFAAGWSEMLNSPEGGLLYVQSLLQEHHPEATPDDAQRLLVDEPQQTEAAVTVISPDFFAAVAVQKGARPDDARAFGEAIAKQLRTGATREPATDSVP